ncbi:E-selectin-like [Rhinophrynus dorsalis]
MRSLLPTWHLEVEIMGRQSYPLPYLEGLTLFTGVQGWSYYYSSTNMTYTEARHYCKAHYTDIVAIQNREENEYLNKILPFNPTYYWIGIRKISKVWTWVGTNKELTEEAKNWARGEPNNKRNNEDCVEMYVKRKNDEGKWNDESCLKKKVALCYTAACNASSCSGHGECIETINNYTCKCDEGFYGSECEHVATCSDLEIPDHGHMSCNGPFGEFMYNSSCEFSCDEGFELIGNQELHCKSEWNGSEPQCEAVKCPAIHLIEQGSVTCSHVNGDFTYNSSCNFTCSGGFELVGSESLQCTAQGKWTDQTPHCEVIYCERPKEPVNGIMSCSSEEILPVESICEFSCAEGFTLVGSPSLFCAAHGLWTEKAPKCEAVVCPSLTIPEQASMDCKDEFGEFQYNSNCSFRCNDGFILTGSETVHCSSSGSWNYDVPACQAVQCESLSAPENGQVECQNESNYKSQCSFTCKEGFALVGSSDVQCLSTGKWTSSSPTCEVVQCELLNAPENGQVICQDGSNYNSKCSFTCAEGFDLVGLSELQCLSSGKWASSPPLCEAIQCPSLNAPENGKVECQGESDYNSKCSFTCAEGFKLIGSSELECSSSGKWTSSPPTCTALECEVLLIPDMVKMNCSDFQGEFKYGSVCRFECEGDLLLNGTNVIECDSTGKWSAELPTCEAPRVPDDSTTNITVGVAVTGTSLLSAASLLAWLAKRLRKTAKKFTPSSSCQSLEDAGVYQNIENQVYSLQKEAEFP